MFHAFFCYLFSFAGTRGRPSVLIGVEQLRMLHDKDFTAKQMASVFKCSSQLIYKKLHESGIHQRDKYSTISDDELQMKVHQLHAAFPNSGVKVKTAVVSFHGVLMAVCRLWITQHTHFNKDIVYFRNNPLLVLLYVKQCILGDVYSIVYVPWS
jgi:hypothetical protein